MRICHIAAALLAAGLFTNPAHSQIVLTAYPASLAFSFAQGAALPASQSISVSANIAGIAVSFTSSTSLGGNWLDISPSTGGTPATLTAQINAFASGLGAGVYTGTIVIASPSAAQSLKIPVTLTVTTSLSVTPASLSFNTQQGVSPAPQTVAVGAPSSVLLAVSATSAGGWLSVTQSNASTPSTLTASVNPAGLAPGTFTGSISISSAAAPTVTVAVTLTVTPAAVLTIAPASLFFQSNSALPQPASQTISVFGSVPSSLVATATIGNAWLSVSPSAAQTPAVLTVSVNPASLSPGAYTGQISVAPSRTQTPTLIPITLTVAAGQAPTLQAVPATLSLSAAQGGSPIQTGLSISNAGGGTLNFTAQTAASWLSLGLTSGAISAGASTVLPVTITPGALTPATYTAPVTVTAGNQTAASLIVLAINAQGPALLLSQTGLAFQALAQAANPPAQTVSVVNTGSANVNWTAATSTLSGGSNWLTVSPAAGTAQPLPAAPPAVSISVNSQGLAPGTYYGSVNVNSQVISVQATVLPSSQLLSPTLSANGVILTAVAGGSNPAPQTISILNPSAFSSTVSTDDGAGWLSLAPATASVSVQGNLAGLSQGIRHGTVRLAFAGGSVQTLSVTSVVAPASASPQVGSPQPDASGGCPSQLVPQISSPALNFSVAAAVSVPLIVSVVDDCGHPLANSTSNSVIASFYDASKPPGSGTLRPDQRLTPQGNGVWAGTWTPQAGIAQIQVVVVALGIIGTNPIAGQTQYVGSVQAAAANAPALAAGIFNAASFQPGNVVALGSFVSIFGSSLADGSNAPTTQPLPTQLEGTQVFLGGIALPLQFAGPNQINALIPANVAVDTQQPLVVQRDSTQAAPTPVTISDAQPGIYTANQQGTGQGAVLTSGNVLDAPAGSFPGAQPAKRGDFIQIFCTGLGAVTNPPAAGAAAPTSPLSTTLSPVTATIGGIDAPVLFSGLAPGFIGLYQVNATVPMSAPVGGAVPLILTAGGGASNTATIAIQ